ncbi:MAG: glucose-phosphate thymidylyltransferase [Thermoleophilia bacterium]|jgi:glucose-1-phosphate thymidylyltransferase|nr:glucose-phosphate thymidylyltransferase [Thermoleophilia bacterium]
MAKGLICAGGEATRLGELTRITNKHLLPVGEWPMVYYSLALLQAAGVREVLIVTGQNHAGDFIDLLGDGHTQTREGEPLFDLDITYKVQTKAGGIAQVVAMAESFAGDDKLVVCLGDNIFEYAEVEAIRSFVDEQESGAKIFLKEVPDPERFGVPQFGDDGEIIDLIEKPVMLDKRFTEAPSNLAVVGLYCFDATVYDIIRTLEPSARGEYEITDVNRAYMERGNLTHAEVQGWWRDAGTYESLGTIGNLIAETGANKVRRSATA